MDSFRINRKYHYFSRKLETSKNFYEVNHTLFQKEFQEEEEKEIREKIEKSIDSCSEEWEYITVLDSFSHRITQDRMYLIRIDSMRSDGSPKSKYKVITNRDFKELKENIV